MGLPGVPRRRRGQKDACSAAAAPPAGCAAPTRALSHKLADRIAPQSHARGAHSYEYVAFDTRNAFACVRPGGVIAWHDFGRVGVNGVGRLVREVARTREVHAIPGGSVAFTVV